MATTPTSLTFNCSTANRTTTLASPSAIFTIANNSPDGAIYFRADGTAATSANFKVIPGWVYEWNGPGTASQVSVICATNNGTYSLLAHS